MTRQQQGMVFGVLLAGIMAAITVIVVPFPVIAKASAPLIILLFMAAALTEIVG